MSAEQNCKRNSAPTAKKAFTLFSRSGTRDISIFLLYQRPIAAEECECTDIVANESSITLWRSYCHLISTPTYKHNFG